MVIGSKLGRHFNMANIITGIRIVCSIALVFCPVFSPAFYTLYIVAGISDMIDGWLARALNCTSKAGALLDSLADICFVVCCSSQLLPILQLPLWLWLWGGIIVVIKVMNQISAIVMHGHCHFPHTLTNKVTGFLLFISVPMMPYSIIPFTIVALIAMFSAIHEGYVIRKKIR